MAKLRSRWVTAVGDPVSSASSSSPPHAPATRVSPARATSHTRRFICLLLSSSDAPVRRPLLAESRVWLAATARNSGSCRHLRQLHRPVLRPGDPAGHGHAQRLVGVLSRGRSLTATGPNHLDEGLDLPPVRVP